MGDIARKNDCHHSILTGIEGLAELKDDWDRLFQSLERPAYYQDWRWTHALMKWLISDPVYFVVCKKGERISLILPLQAGKISKAGIETNSIGFLTHSHIVLSDLICDRTALTQADAKALFSFLSKQKQFDWNTIFLKKYAEGSLTKELLTLAGYDQKEMAQNAFFSTDNEDFEAGLSKKFIKNIRRLEKKAVTELGPVVSEVGDCSAENKNRFNTFLEMEASGWKGENGTSTAIMHNSALMSFYQEVIDSFSKDKSCAVNLLHINGEAAAGQLCIKSASTWFILKIAYQDELKRYGAGNILMLKFLELASSDDEIDEVNLVTSPEWASRWHLNNRAVYECQHYNSNLVGRLLKSAVNTRDKIKSLKK